MYTLKRIYLPENAPAQAIYAADELRYYISRMCARPCPVQSDTTADAVILEQVVCDTLGEDGFSLTPKEGAVRIRGGKRGIIYGAYELLERLGCRFFTPECEKVPTVSEVVLDLWEEVIQKPILEYREHNYTDLRRSPRFAVKSRVNGHHHPIPEKLGGNMSYSWYVHSFEYMIPTSKYGQDHPEFYAMLEDGTRPQTYARFRICLTAWGEVCNRIYIWDYTTCFAHYPTPHPNWHALQPNMKAFVRNHVKGVFEQANGAYGGGVDLNELRAYIITKLLWDAETDVQKHMEEFTDYYYGAGGVYIREYIEALCRKAEDDMIHVGFNDNPVSELFSEEMLDIYDSILEKAEQATADDPLRCRRVQKARLSVRWVRLKRAAMLRHEHNAEEINSFFEDWNSFGLTRIDEWVSSQTTLRALLDDKWRGTEYYEHWSCEGGEIL